MPQPSVADWAQLEYYADELEEVAEYYHTEVGQPVYGDDDDWVRKLEVVADAVRRWCRSPSARRRRMSCSG